MRISNLSRHLKEQNWFAVFLDLSMIVLGVFLGIRANEWNESNKLRKLESVYLNRVHEDIRISIEVNERNIKNMLRYAEHATSVIKSLDKCSIDQVEQEKFAAGLFSVGKVNPPYMMKGTITELISTGKYDIIRDVDLRSKIADVTQTVESNLSLESQITGRITPHVNYIESKIAFDIQYPISGSKNPSWSNLKFELSDLCSDKQFQSSVSAARAMTYTVIKANQDIVVKQKSILKIMDGNRTK